ncbi:hypothetical protein STZ1_30489 [Bacillus subtilis]
MYLKNITFPILGKHSMFKKIRKGNITTRYKQGGWKKWHYLQQKQLHAADGPDILHQMTAFLILIL